MIGYTFPLFPLEEEFCRFYQVCPAQLSPYTLKVLLLLTKYAELAECNVSIHHLLHLFSPSFHRGTMVLLRHRGTKRLVVGTFDRASRKFWHKYFFVKTEHIVSDSARFSERWNETRKCRHSFYSSFVCIRYKVCLLLVCSYGMSAPPYCGHKGLSSSFVIPRSGNPRLALLRKALRP